MQYNGTNIKFVQDIAVKNQLVESLENLYNVHQKYDFIGYKYATTSNDNIVNILRTFNRLGNYENQFDKDICNFSYQEYKEMLAGFNIGYSSFSAIKTLVKTYLKWCRYYDLCDNNQISTFDQITKDVVPYKNQIVRYYVKDFNDLKEYIETCIKNMILVKSEYDILCHRAKIAMYLAWIGIKADHAVRITLKDFDEINKRIFVRDTNSYVELSKFEPILVDELVHYKMLAESNSDQLYLFYDETNTKDPSSYLKNIVSVLFGNNEKVVNKGNKRLSYTRVYLSGIFSRATQYADKVNLKDLETMGELFQEDYSGKSGYSAMYRRYRDFMSYCEIMYPEIYKIIKFK